MLDIRLKLKGIGVAPKEAIVIGSGIMNALHIRKSNDIDLVVVEKVFSRLQSSGKFGVKEVFGRPIIFDDLFEIGLGWNVLGRQWDFMDLYPRTKVVGGVRYVTLDFLLRIKEDWIRASIGRPKDVQDVRLIQDYFRK